ncbi:MAG: hypothetical protein COA41_12480 [Sphingopyxis sp.]|nr:MAG: hypothetical protein COA41_12480 [Sphingopyxis sp.]
MRFIILSALLGLASVSLADSSSLSEASRPSGWQTQCFGRVQFFMPGSQGWFNQLAKPPEPYKGNQTTPAIWRGNYGRDPLHSDKVLVQIAVSRLATLEYWKRDTSYFRPSRGEAQERVLRRQIDEIDKRMDELRAQYSDYYQNPEYAEAHGKLRNDQRALEDAQQHIGKVSTDILWVSEAIENFREQGKDTAQLEAKLAGLMIEDAKYPVDDLFEQEYFVELNRPNALAISGPYDFSASLWENGRIYTFQFGMEHNKPRSEQKSLEPAALDFLARFRARPEHEIPEEPGVCLPFGFIADNGNVPFDFAYRWQPRGKPALLYRIDQPASKEHLAHTLMRLVPNPYSSFVGIDSFGPDDVSFGFTVGSIVGSRSQRRDPERPDWHPPETYHLIAETGPQQQVPSVSFEMKIQDPDAEFQPFEQGQAEFKQILDSFLPLPGMMRQ